jgi:tetratricopeptide (TPR) repeat protein
MVVIRFVLTVARSSVLALALMAVQLGAPLAAQWPPDSIVNLRVLPKDMPFDSLVGLMAGFTRALDVRCSHCHVGEEPEPLATYDFASDAKAAKRTARAMLEMVNAINGRHLNELESRVQPALRVECFTCHRGAREPRKLQDVLVAAWDEAGIDSVLTAYRNLRQQNIGSAVFDFGEVVLADVGTVLEERGRLAEAAQLDALNVEMNPASSFARRQHAMRGLQAAYGESEAAGRARFDELLAAYGPTTLSEAVVNQIGYALLRRGLQGAALDVFRRNVERFPDSWNAHDSLADGYAREGNTSEAIRHYEKSLALNPGNTNAADRLRALRARQDAEPAPPSRSRR